jgi:methionine synthase II (cobalamin-independent)
MTTPRFPWGVASATGIGSLPGTDSREAARIVAGALPEFLHCPELPARGPGADMIGRTAALLAAVSDDFGFETTPAGWRITAGRGRTLRRAISWLSEDLDALEETSAGYAGPIKAQIVGPWTMAASVELPFGERMLKDPGACRDLADALAEAVRIHLGDLRRRFPRSEVIVQWDEPAITAVLEGSIGTASGISRYSAIEAQKAESHLRTVLGATTDAQAMAGIHCCATRPPIGLFRSSGAKFVSIDVLNGQVDEDELGEIWEAGVGILAGSVPGVGSTMVSDTRASEPVRAIAARLGLNDIDFMAGVVVTPTCGLAGASPDWVRMAYTACVKAGRVLREGFGEDAEDLAMSRSRNEPVAT